MKALIDGDTILYRCGFAGQRHAYRAFLEGEEEHGWIAEFTGARALQAWLEQHYSKPNAAPIKVDGNLIADPLSHVLHSTKMFVESILNNVSRDHIIFFSGKENFRYKIYPEYKANRKDAERPIHFLNILQYLQDKYNCETVNYEEADDALGRLGYAGQGVICTNDKDLRMIPGKHYHIIDQTWSEIDKLSADQFFMAQLYAGDDVDNIRGLKGYGIKRGLKKVRMTMTEWIRHKQEVYNNVKTLYKQQGLGEKLLQINAECLWIKRDDRPWYEHLEIKP